MADDDTEDPPVRVRKAPPHKLDVSNELLRDVDTAPGVIRTLHLSPEANARLAARLSADQAAADRDTDEGSGTQDRSGGPGAR